MTIKTVTTGAFLAHVDASPGVITLSGAPTSDVRTGHEPATGRRGAWSDGVRAGFDAQAARPRTHALVPTAAAYMAEVQDSPSRGRPV